MAKKFKIVTRKSRLALAQVDLVIKAIQAKNPDFEYEIIEILSQGCYDRFKGDLHTIGGKGVFVKDLEKALLEGEADFAVHSMKDVPTDEEMPQGLVIPAVLPRADIRDVIVCREGDSLVSLKEGAMIGTSSVRRSSQIYASFPHLKTTPIRGNVDTRLQKLKNGEVDAVMLAKAGLDRLGLVDTITEVMEPDMIMPACGQGVVGIQCREKDSETAELLASINDEETMTCLTAERAMLQKLGGNCHTPIGGYCEYTLGGNLRLLAMVAAPDGSRVARARIKMPKDDPHAVGLAAADELLSQGAAEIIGLSAA